MKRICSKSYFKFIYYELTSKGETITKPKLTTQIVLVLSAGIAMLLYGIIGSLPKYQVLGVKTRAAEAVDVIISAEGAQSELVDTVMVTIPHEPNFLAFIIIGIAILLVALFMLKK